MIQYKCIVHGLIGGTAGGILFYAATKKQNVLVNKVSFKKYFLNIGTLSGLIIGCIYGHTNTSILGLCYNYCKKPNTSVGLDKSSNL